MSAPMKRRDWLAQAGSIALAGLTPWSTQAAGLIAPRTLQFPTDFGAHPETRTEWWYVTGWLSEDGASQNVPQYGFQITFFRSRTGVAADHPSAFAARQLVMAHAALTDLRAGKQRHDQRIARAGFGLTEATTGDTAVRLADWRLNRTGASSSSAYSATLQSTAAAFGLDLQFTPTQPLLLQGQAGYSRKGPAPEQASHYYSQPQLATRGQLQIDGRRVAVTGRAWLDHEWSESVLAPDAVGWDWLGINLLDGSTLTAFRLRRADGTALWAGGSWRRADGTAQSFAPGEVQFTPGRLWTSPATGARYPVEWAVTTPAGRHTLRALLDAQELDSRASTGTVYWEGLSELLDERGARLGLGYLEMTGYAARLKL